MKFLVFIKENPHTYTANKSLYVLHVWRTLHMSWKVDERVPTSLGKKLVLLTFQLDALDLHPDYIEHLVETLAR